MSTAEDTVTSGGFRIPRLAGKDNYKTWKVNMVDILSDGDLLEHIKKIPEDLFLANALEEAKAKIRKHDRKALGQIRLRCSGFAGVYVESATLAKEAWDRLRTEFEDSGASTRFIFRRQLYASKMADGDDLDVHLQKLRRIYQDLKVAGDNLPESEFLITLICSLPTSWDTFIASIDYSEVESNDEKIKQKAIDSILAHLRCRWENRPLHKLPI